MRIEVGASSPTYGGGGSIDHVGQFLVEGLGPVGTAVASIEVRFLLTALPKAPRDDTDEEGLDMEALLDALGAEAGETIGIGPSHPEWGSEHEEARQRGPTLVFRRGARRIDVRLVSDLSELDVFGRDPSPETFSAAARELIAALAALEKRLKKGDDLDLSTLTAHLNARLAQVPGSTDELNSVVTALAHKRMQRWKSKSHWDQLNVDWSLFAPRLAKS